MRSLALLMMLMATQMVFSQADASTETPTNVPVCFHPRAGQVCALAPRALNQPAASYSEKARKKKLQGTVVLSIVVGTDGAAHDIKVTKSLGMGLDEEAVKSVQKWKFEPSTVEGKPVAVRIALQVDFRLY